MKRIAIAAILATLAVPASAESFRPGPSLPRVGIPVTIGDRSDRRGGWDTRDQDRWDRMLRHCLNDRRQSGRERRACADAGMPVKERRRKD